MSEDTRKSQDGTTFFFNLEPFGLLHRLARQIDRDLLIYDLETSDLLDSENFGITEIAVMRVFRDGTIKVHTRMLNPERPISPKASEITGITDDDVKDREHYGEGLAKAMCGAARDCLVIGFNIRNFDIPGILKIHERYGFDTPWFVDVLDVRDLWIALSGKKAGRLTDIVEMYGLHVEDAHQAAADVAMTGLVLNQMLWRHGVDAALRHRITDTEAASVGAVGDDGRSHAPKALSKSFVIRERLKKHFAEGGDYTGMRPLAKLLGFSDDERFEADGELSGLIRSKDVSPEQVALAVPQEFLAKHLESVLTDLGVDPSDGGFRLKPVMEGLKAKSGFPKDLDYIQLRAALVMRAEEKEHEAADGAQSAE
jgi:DNA polymerase III epsilon subunit-like protein